jgi:hypothetical protein
MGAKEVKLKLRGALYVETAHSAHEWQIEFWGDSNRLLRSE